MTIFARLWAWLSLGFDHVFGANAPAIAAWGKQFLTDEGAVIFADVAKYGAEIFAGTTTITAAAASAWVDLKAKGIQDGEQAIETVFNALRTHTNLAAATTVSPTASAAPEAAPVSPVDPANAPQPPV